MPPHLHPRSTATSTLFAGTLLASFVVVGIPHVFPCPRPRKGYADSGNAARQQQRSRDDLGSPKDEEEERLRLQLSAKNRRRGGQGDTAEAEDATLGPSSLRDDVSGKGMPIMSTARSSKGPRATSSKYQVSQSVAEGALLFRQLEREAAQLEAEARECPVPKPRGVLGRWLGFEEKKLEGDIYGASRQRSNDVAVRTLESTAGSS